MVVRDRRRRIFLAVLAFGVIAAGLLGWAGTGAVAQGTVGVVDSGRIIDEYLVEELREPLTRATQELQQAFDEESAGMDDAEKQILFEEYQARLEAVREALVQERLPAIQTAIQAVAESHEVTLVLDRSAVHFGGIDLTDEVLARLGVIVASP